MKESKMKTLLVVIVTALALIQSASAAEIPQSVIGQDWCLADGSDWAFIPVAGCKSLVIKRDAVIWNKKDRQESCSITNVEVSGWIRIKGSCQARDGSFRALDFAFYEHNDGCPPHGERCLLLIFEPWRAIPGAQPPKRD
jgi:hypothetical protein